MARPAPKPTPLRETPSAAPFGSRVIDVDFTVVAEGRAPRPAQAAPKPKPTLLKRIKTWATAIAIAVLIGVMIPPSFLLWKALFG